MSSTYSPDLRIELIGTGDQAGVWGATTNTNLGTLLESAIAGYTSVSVSSANQALTVNSGAADEARYAALALTTVTGANFNVYIPPSSKLYVLYNASSYTATIYCSTVAGNTTAAGTGIAIPSGKKMALWTDGTNVYQQNDYLISPTLVTPALGTPSSGTLTNATGLPISTGVSGLGSGVATFLSTPSSANLAAAVSDETGSGALVFATSPTLVTPALGTPSSATLTNATGLPIDAGTTGTLPVLRGGTGVTSSTGSGNNVLSNSPTLVTPALGTPSSATLTNATGLPISTGVSGLGTGVATALAVNVGTAGAPVVNGGALGAPSSGTLTNATGLPIDGGTTGTLPVSRGGTGVTQSTGSGKVVLDTSPTLVTPALGTPVSGNFSTGTFTWPTFNQNTSGSAASATNATYATSAGSATNATSASSATNATYATSAGSATNATSASSATNATYATSAGSATNASAATNATYATTSGSTNSITTAQVLTATAALSADAVGSYALCRHDGGTTAYYGDTVAGSILRPSSAWGSAYSAVRTGTWRCLGGSTTDGSVDSVSLFLRIA